MGVESDNRIIFLTPLGQMLRAKQKELGFPDYRMADWLRINRASYRSALVNPINKISKRTIAKICTKFNIASPPQLPENLSPLDSVVYGHQKPILLRIPTYQYCALRRVDCAAEIQQFTINFANSLVMALRKSCMDIMAIEWE